MSSPLTFGCFDLQRQQYASAKKLLESGASLEQADGNRMSVLSVAAHAGDAKLCNILLEFGAPLASRDMLGLTALHYAAFMGHKVSAGCWVRILRACVV
jgi:ankyrin repeat protein